MRIKTAETSNIQALCLAFLPVGIWEQKKEFLEENEIKSTTQTQQHDLNVNNNDLK